MSTWLPDHIPARPSWSGWSFPSAATVAAYGAAAILASQFFVARALLNAGTGAASFIAQEAWLAAVLLVAINRATKPTWSAASTVAMAYAGAWALVWEASTVWRLMTGETSSTWYLWLYLIGALVLVIAAITAAYGEGMRLLARSSATIWWRPAVVAAALLWLVGWFLPWQTIGTSVGLIDCCTPFVDSSIMSIVDDLLLLGLLLAAVVVSLLLEPARASGALLATAGLLEMAQAGFVLVGPHPTVVGLLPGFWVAVAGMVAFLVLGILRMRIGAPAEPPEVDLRPDPDDELGRTEDVHRTAWGPNTSPGPG